MFHCFTDYAYGKKGKAKSKPDGGTRRSSRNRRVLYDDMDDFVVSGSDSDESYTNRKKKSKGRSKSYREDSWDSAVTSDDSYTKKKSAKKKKPARTKTSNSRPKWSLESAWTTSNR